MFNSFAALTPISSVIVQSTTLDYSKGEEGSWQYTKSAKWISKGKARINIKLETVEKPRAEYADVILVLDVSGSMIGDKLTQVQRDVTSLINDTILKGNKIAIVTFSDDASVITDFTSNATLLQESINDLVASGETNYYQALVKVDDILNTYNKESNRDCVVLFLTDGLPTVDTPNEIGQYSYLKTKYEYLSINGIQYEFGDEEILEGVKNITDTQYIADRKSLNEFLYKASISPTMYDSFTLIDYIDENYFNLVNISNVDTTFGTTSIIDNRVVWDLSGIKSGWFAELNVDVNLNDNLIGVGGRYSTHEKTEVTYKITSISTKESSTETPVLRDDYVVTYDANAPNGCVVSNMPNQKNYSVFDTVKIENVVPKCEGYQFKHWEIVTENVKRIGRTYFVMPEANVTIKAIWKDVKLIKSMDGTIEEVQTLYELMSDNSKGVDTNVNFNSTPNVSNSGIYTRSGTENDQYPVHYYRGIIDNNNVLFAGFCWKMVRTTSTGGVKVIYNGTPDENGSCNNTDTATQIGTSIFNSGYVSPAYVGYMYGKQYNYAQYGSDTLNVLSKYSTSSSSNYYYGTAITYSNGTYTLKNASQKNWANNYSNLVGYYTCRNTSTTCSVVYYIAGSASSYQYVFSLSGGATDPTTRTIILGKNRTANGDGTYSLRNIVTIEKKDWFTNYSAYKGYYFCKGLSTVVCDTQLITATNNYQIFSDKTNNFIYGNDVSWDGSKYTLIDTFTSTNFWPIDKVTIAKKYHYTCLNTTGECTDVYYIHYFGSDSTIYYLTLSSGKNIEKAKEEMFTNTTSSKIKQTIDDWYASNMKLYTKKLEDTIWCNDRTLYSGSLVGKDSDAGTSVSQFSAYNRVFTTYNPSLTCPNEARDGFTVSTISGGNGALTYPVGLLTADEVRLAGGYENTHYLYTGQYYWTLSPSYFSEYDAYGFAVNSSGKLYNYIVYSHGVRPSVSLALGARAIDGLGTINDPYVVE